MIGRLWWITLWASSHVVTGLSPRSRLSLPTSSRFPIAIKSQPNKDTWAEKQLDELSRILNRVDKLQENVQQWNATTEDDNDRSQLETMQRAVQELEDETRSILSSPLPPVGVSMDEFQAAVTLFFNLPPMIRLALVISVGMEDGAAADPTRIPEIVTKLYENKDTLTQQRLVDALQQAKAPLLINPLELTATGSEGGEAKGRATLFPDLFEEEDVNIEEKEIEQSVKNFLPRVTRKKDMVPSQADADLLMDTIGNNIFLASSRPIQIPGGYIVRGENRKKSGKDLIAAIDEKIPPNWDCTVCYMYDVSDVDEEKLFEKNNALVLLKKDFSPASSDWFYRGTSLIALGTLFLFSVGVYGANQDVLNRLTDASALNDFASLDWFNGKVAQMLAPILVILASHELGHIIVAKKNKIETTSLIPTFLPMFGNLPLLGTLTRIKSSPQNRTALFDFALLGPLFGFLSSFLFLGIGLFATKAAMEVDSGSAAQYLPALPVSVLNLSTLGGSIIDYFFAGGDGYITALDPQTPVTLHPLAIAGYCGLLINAAEMLPLGATDGGRLSIAVFGRRGQSIIGGFTWFLLLVSSFMLADQQGALLITAWATNNVFQNDMEVPCRDESDNVSLERMVVAFALWFLAALIIIPMNHPL
jgi:hypothetical protein